MTLRKKESTNLGIQLSIRHTYCIDNIDLHHLRPPFTPILLFLWQEINILPWFEKILTSMHNYGDLGSNHKKAGFQKKLGKFLLTKIERKQSFGVQLPFCSPEFICKTVYILPRHFNQRCLEKERAHSWTVFQQNTKNAMKNKSNTYAQIKLSKLIIFRMDALNN